MKPTYWGRWLSLVAAILIIAPGCGGPQVTFPEPRVVDDEEESPALKVATVKPPNKAQPNSGKAAESQSQQLTSNRPRAATAKPAPQSRADAVRVAANRAAQGGGDNGQASEGTHPRATDETSGTHRPNDLADWTHDDFRSAKQERDVRLVQAVALLGRGSDNPAADARLLVELLDPPHNASAHTPGSGIPATTYGLPQAIVAGLAANTSQFARDALKEVLLGKLQTNLNDRAFTIAALKALIETSGYDAEAIIHAILTMPEAIRPPGRGDFTADALQKECVNLVRSSASPQLRLRVAQHVANPSTPAAHRTVLLPMLLEQRGENVPAQAALALAQNFDANQRSTLQRQLLGQLRRAMDRLMDTPDAPLLHGPREAAIRAVFESRRPAPLQETVQVTNELWSPAFVKRLAARLDETRNASDQAELLALATSIPSDLIRPVVHQYVSEHWLEGEELSLAPQFAPSTIRDPGMLLVLKTLPRDLATVATKASRARGGSTQKQLLAREYKARQAWNAAVYTMVQTLMRRCEIGGEVRRIAAQQTPASSVSQPIESVAALDRMLQSRSAATSASPDEHSAAGGEPSTAGGLPLDVPPDAEVEAAYTLHWPEQLEGQVNSMVSPLTVHYTRLRFEDQGQRAVAFFARQLKGAHERPLENGRWLDSDSRPAPGTYRSVDVMITLAKPAAAATRPTRRAAVEKLAAEILWIEIDDFATNDSRLIHHDSEAPSQ
jgi:hypothetical protein